MGFLDNLFNMADKREIKAFSKVADKIDAMEPKFEAMTNKELKNMTNIFKERLAKGETLDDILPEAFATVREASKRVLGLRHYNVQLIGGMVLHQGRIAEMKKMCIRDRVIVLQVPNNFCKILERFSLSSGLVLLNSHNKFCAFVFNEGSIAKYFA